MHTFKVGSIGSLLALQAISNQALSSAELPARLKLLNWGDNATTQGLVKVGPQTADRLAANQALFGFDRVALDYDHNSLKGHANYKPDPREVAGYGVPEIVPGEGLYLSNIIYTPSGRRFAREYADLSPTPRLNEAGEVDFLHSVALCPQGAVEGLSFFSAGQPGQSADEAVRIALGLPKEAWQRHNGGQVAALSASGPRKSQAARLGQTFAEDTVRRALNISDAAWNRHGSGGLTALDARDPRENAAEGEKIRRELNLSEDAWAQIMADATKRELLLSFSEADFERLKKKDPQILAMLGISEELSSREDAPSGQPPTSKASAVMPLSASTPGNEGEAVRRMLGISPEIWKRWR